MGRASTGATRAVSARARVGEAGTGNIRPINRYINTLSGSQRTYARGYLRAITGAGDAGGARQRAADSGVSASRIRQIESQIDATTRRLTDRRRGVNR